VRDDRYESIRFKSIYTKKSTMKKITILEVWDPYERKYVPLKQAINQGLFNTETYLFFNPIEKKFYSITEAARLCLFKSAIDLR